MHTFIHKHRQAEVRACNTQSVLRFQGTSPVRLALPVGPGKGQQRTRASDRPTSLTGGPRAGWGYGQEQGQGLGGPHHDSCRQHGSAQLRPRGSP